MPHALAVFPWIALDQPMTIGDVRLLPYRAGGRKRMIAQVAQADVNAIFKAYRNRPKEPVRQGMIFEIGDWKSGMEMGGAMADRSNQAREVLAFSALSNRRLFCGRANFIDRGFFIHS